MGSDLILGVDQGSSSTKTILYDPKSKKILARTRVRIATNRKERGNHLIVEQDPEEIRSASEKAIKAALEKAPANASVSTGIASQRSSFLLVERATLKPLTPAISWQDTRGMEILEGLKGMAATFYQKTGLYLTPYYSLTKLLWLFKHQPSLYKRAQKGEVLFSFIPTYLALRWSNGNTFACDPTLAQRSLLMNLNTCQWDEELLERLKIPRQMLPEIRQTSDGYGWIETPRRRIPVRAMIGDQQAAFLALTRASNIRQTGLINLGTGGFLIVPTGKSPLRAKGLLTGIQHAIAGKTEYMVEGTVNSIQGTLKWMEGLGILKNADKFQIPRLSSKDFLLRIPVVSGGFGGLAAPFWRNDIQVTVSGLDRATSRENLMACFLFGIAHMFWEILKPLANSKAKPAFLAASGGLSRNKGLLEILANYLELPIRQASDADLTALGACAATKESVRLPIELGNAVKPEARFRSILKQYRQTSQNRLQKLLEGV